LLAAERADRARRARNNPSKVAEEAEMDVDEPETEAPKRRLVIEGSDEE